MILAENVGDILYSGGYTMKRQTLFSAVGLMALGMVFAGPGLGQGRDGHARSYGHDVRRLRISSGGCTGRSQRVKQADVSSAKKEAVVKFDSDVAKVEQLVKAVKEASGPHGLTMPR